MTDDELANKLKEITHELRDLKTSHERGLGTTRFYRYEIEIMAQAESYYNFIARVADDEPQSPVIIPAMQTEAPLGAIAPYCYFFSIIFIKTAEPGNVFNEKFFLLFLFFCEIFRIGVIAYIIHSVNDKNGVVEFI